MNGRLVPEDEARVSVFDHGLLYGDGVFEGLRAYSGRVFRLREHLQRLWASARAICLEIPTTPEQLGRAIEETLAANGLADGYVRVVITRGAGSLGLDPGRTRDPQVIVIADTIALYPPELTARGLRLVTAATQRSHPAALSPRIKSLNYLNNIMAKLEGQQAGCVEALMLNHKGEVAECTADNVFVVRGDRLLTPPPDAGILEGITRGAVMELALAAGIDCREATLTRHDIYTADECFITGTAAEVVPVVELDGRKIGSGTPGPVTLRLQADFHTLVRGNG
jgi:branched-chain amino acid aminotransferase